MLVKLTMIFKKMCFIPWKLRTDIKSETLILKKVK